MLNWLILFKNKIITTDELWLECSKENYLNIQKKKKKLAFSESVYTHSLRQVRWGKISLARGVLLDVD